ncbi:phospholipid carrier-dependent glycosyltransferase [Clostridiisalibacter paucivorans]|uniref:phospholipid carrier-dependent glycosyltransferase n=1 Tax=Clostridiisalibacter paucivorans TaxID=408753 RepID=UPI00047B8D7C|nr:glycosyltransferase family 39 protein [Clostridiisalibacter paucivorans]
MIKNKFDLNRRIFIVLIAIYFILNLIFLTKFPFVHSDEPWLSGLSRNILEKKSFSVTETFFDLYERNPHAIKSLFHLIQIFFLKIFGYNIFTFRLISLIFGTMTLFFFYRLSYILFKSKNFALFSTFLLSIDVQYIYASHFARQEIILLFVLVLGLYVFYKNNDINNYYRDIIIGILIGLSIGIHPNSFIISLGFGTLYLYHILITKKLKSKNIAIYISIVSLFATCFVLISFQFDPNFLNHYANYGSKFGVLKPITSKFKQIKNFYLKLYYGVSGTYYTPNIKFQFYLFVTVLFITLIKIFSTKNKSKKEYLISMILVILSVNIGIISIGRFNATSIIFLFPAFYLLTVYIIRDCKKWKALCIALVSISLIITTSINILPYLDTSYDNYLTEIGRIIKKDDTVLANLNSEYYFENGKLYDYRNLSYLKKYNMSFSDYIYNREIKYIVYSEEMDYIYNARPIWNGVYGNPYFYYNDMKNFLNTKCTLIHKFKDNIYGIRIARYINTRDWWIKIYKVNK